MRRYLAAAAAGLTVITGTGIAVAQAAPAADVVTRTGTLVNTCANPVVDRDITGWGRHGTGATGTRVAARAHVAADHAYRQPSTNGVNPEMYLPQKNVSGGERWRFAVDSWVSGAATSVTARMQVDWYDASGAYLGHANGGEVAITPNIVETWTRVAAEFTAPGGAGRANVTARLAGPAGLTWSATACDYQPVSPATPPPTTPPPTGADTAAARYGWGTPLPASDEFDYGSVAAPAQPDATKWTHAGSEASGCWPGHNGNGRRCEENSRVLGGIMRMTGESGGDSGLLGSRFAQRYGRWEVRARSQGTSADNGRQFHPVLLLWPDNEQWPEGAEYDYLENSAPGEQCAGAFLHYPNHQPKVQEQAEKCGVDLSGWHNFAFEWTPDHVKGFIDGTEWFVFSADCIQCAPGPMFQTIQLDNFYGDDLQSAVFEVDWARVYAL
ncbi:glycoside hydrolase family 16 protein [Catenuloplanes sp. NPDC051500]|uniref:glycoside hydrolase family 16 protein n=1 Tax=Catenuloplanes sp. NPDC051500 TaxID=3363959 RepID=UPI0037BBDCDE